MAQEKQNQSRDRLVRILTTDIPGEIKLYAGLTRVKGISWTISNAICKELKLNKQKKMTELTEQEIEKINTFLKNLNLPSWLLNRRKDFETGKDKHLFGTELDLQKEFDIRKLKKIKSYKGVRHIQGQPVRGQRTRGHFRKKGRTVGVTRQKAAPAKGKGK
jgi:small subunit ribosomal protein S13